MSPSPDHKVTSPICYISHHTCNDVCDDFHKLMWMKEIIIHVIANYKL